MKKILFALLVISIIGFGVNAQITLPPGTPNKKASVSERIGITEVEIQYNRPAVNGREGKIWGGIVHFGFADLHYGTSKAAPWRAGADENTTIYFSTDVNIEGNPLSAGTYGFFIAMGKEKATLIFSKHSTAWGSFFYDPKDDALRVEVKVSMVNETVERLKYEFSDQTENSAIISLQWEKARIPFKVSVDLHKEQIAVFRREFNSGIFYRYWQNMHAAANYCLENNVNLEEGLSWADRSINTYFGESNFLTLSTYAGLSEKLGNKAKADSIMKKAYPMASMMQLSSYARSLQKQKKNQEAFQIYKMNNEKYPNEIQTQLEMIKGYALIGDTNEAVKAADKVISKVKDPNFRAYLEKMKGEVKEGRDISKM